MYRGKFYLCLVSMLLLLELGTAHSSSNDKSGAANREALIRQATQAGMDEPALAELMRTQQPVVISRTNAQGQMQTTTYSLTPDGAGISSRMVLEETPKLVHATHDSLAVTPLPSAPSTNPENDWEWAPAARGGGNTRTYTYSGTRPFSFDQSFGRDWPSVFDNRQPAVGSDSGINFGNRNWFFKPDFELPAGVTPQTSTKTEVDDQGRTVTTTRKFYSSNSPTNPNTPSIWQPPPSFFDGAEVPRLTPKADPKVPPTDFGAPQTSTNTEVDDQGRTVTTTTKNYGGNIPSIWQHRTSFFDGAEMPRLTPKADPKVPPMDFGAPQTSTKTEVDDQGRTVTTTTKIYGGNIPSIWQHRTSFFGESDPSQIPRLTPASWPRPSLFDETEEPRLTPKLPAAQPSPLPTPTSSSNNPPPLIPAPTPVPMITTTALPSLDDFLSQQYGPGASVTRHRLEDFTTTTTPRTLATINIDELPGSGSQTVIKSPAQQPPIDDNWLRGLSDSWEPQRPLDGATKVSTVRRTYNTAVSPTATISDLNDQLRDVLTRGGFTDADLHRAQGNVVTRTQSRTEPDGSVVRTTYTVRTLPSSHSSSATLFNTQQSHEITTANPIDKFLSQVNLSPSEILAQKGEVIKTLVDDDGRVLSATFVLSTVKGDKQGEREEELPTK